MNLGEEIETFEIERDREPLVVPEPEPVAVPETERELVPAS